MELAGIVRIMWARRILVALGIVAAVAVGLLAGRVMEARHTVATAGVGKARMVLDTAHSQLVAAAPKGADTLAMRASLLADTLATRAGRSAIARMAGIHRKDLLVLFPAATKEPTDETPLVKQLLKMTSATQAPYLVNVIVDDITPIISIEAYAADNAHVRRLTTATISALRSRLTAEDGTGTGGFVLDTIAPPRLDKLPAGSHTAVVMLGAAIVTFAFWCLSIVLVAAVSRRWRGLAQEPDVVARRRTA